MRIKVKGGRVLPNKLNIDNQVELSREEERISKQKAILLYNSNKFTKRNIGKFKSLSSIHKFLFGDIYYFAGKIRDENLCKGNFRFANVPCIDASIKSVEQIPETSVEEIVSKYVEMNVVHPFREGNGRSLRIWLDLMLKLNLGVMIDWSKIDRQEYLLAMEKSVVDSSAIKELVSSALTRDISSKKLVLENIDISFSIEGFDFFSSRDVERK